MLKQNNSKAQRYPLRALPFAVLGGFCLFYYILIYAFSGSQISITWIWLLGAVFLFGLGSCFYIWGGIAYKNPFCLVCIIIVGLLLLYFLVFESVLIVNSFSEPPENVDCIIVLGASVRGERPSKALAYRINAAHEYLKNNPDTVAVLSGGQGKGEDISEAECMYRELTSLGIDGSRLFLEDKSTNTSENIKNSLELIGEECGSIAVVTNNFHVFRAKCLLGASYKGEIYAISASFNNPLVLHYAVREFVGFSHDAMVGNFGS